MIIMLSCQGQLGNQMILFSHFMAFSIENDLTLVNLNFNKYTHLFESTHGSLFACYPVEKTIFYRNEALVNIFRCLMSRPTKIIDKYQINTGFLKVISDYRLKGDDNFKLDDESFKHSLASHQIIVSHGYLFRAHSLLEKYSDAIRRYFIPISIYSNNVSFLIEGLRREADILVGVHIRRGDYKNFLNGKYFYEVKQYAQMMKQVQNLFATKSVKFLICSDVEQRTSDFKEFNFSFGTKHFLEDMYSLASCDYIMGPPSSYTGWAAFYGKVPLYVVDDPASQITLESFQIYPTPMV